MRPARPVVPLRMTGGSLCTGYGGLDLAVHALLPDLNLRWMSEIDKDAAAVLAARFPGVPNIGDLIVADPEPVDVLTAGFPCQPVSQAGRRKGLHDERWLWDDIADLVGRMDPRPRMLLLENVPGLLTANRGDAMARVVHRLAELGYVGSWRTLRASDVGACHRRARVFIIATLADSGGERRREASGSATGDEGSDGRADADHEPGGVGEGRLLPTPTANQDKGPGHEGRAGGLNLQTAVALLPTPRANADRTSRKALVENQQWSAPSLAQAVELADGILPREFRTWDEVPGHSRAMGWGDYADAIARHAAVTGAEPPPPTVGKRLNPVFVEWMMMLPAGWVTDVDISHTAKLRILGNGVVPPQAAAAYTSLLGGCA